MRKSEAKRVAVGLVAADLSATLGTNAWEDQGLLEGYDQADRDRIHEGASEFLDELYRRLGRGDR